MIFLDTDIIIDLLKGKSYAKQIIGNHKEYMASTDINYFELLFGALKHKSQKEELAIKELFSTIPTYPMSNACFEKAAKIATKLIREGKEIGQNDCFIAAIVIENNGTLLTRNTKHFKRIKELQLIEV